MNRLFQSVAEVAGEDGIGVILTGMGSDGADGLEAMKRTGASTIAESRSSAAVFGMPRKAIERGVVDRVVPDERIAHAIMRAVRDREESARKPDPV